MTDATKPVPISKDEAFSNPEVIRRLARRHAAERRFQFYGMSAIAFSVLALFILVFSIVSEASSAFTRHHVVFDLNLLEEQVIPETGDTAEDIASNVSGFNKLVQDNLLRAFPTFAEDRLKRRELFAIVPRLGVLPMARKTAERPETIGTNQSFRVVLSDDLDLFLKGRVTGRRALQIGNAGRLGEIGNNFFSLSDAGPDGFPNLQEVWADRDQLGGVLVSVNGSWYRLLDVNGAVMSIEFLAGQLPQIGEQNSASIEGLVLSAPESDRTISDHQIAWTLSLQDQGRVERRLNTSLISHSDSTYPELAGAAAAIVGSILTMIFTAAFAIPIGIFAAVYLEEFAPTNRLTGLIEVNINNLAAVPSIVFGLLGASVFLDAFGLPRSVPFVGGLVLGLLVLPTVIIASRAALRSVPPSIRTAALGLGASQTQTVFHHVLPLAAPGILTGAIIAMARALGETAPLLLIGMVAFVNEVPTGPNDEATVLPVLIFKWFSGAERAWEPMTSAVVIILLVLLMAMSLTAVLLRRHFERRW
ncbi:MAG: phosphate ABC transporter permease PstA [Pseudomonadota bacterium]